MLVAKHHSIKHGIGGWEYKVFRKEYCENIDGRLGFTCTTTITAFAFPGATRERIRQIEAIKLSGKCGICHIPKIHLKNALQTFKSMR